MTKTCKNCGHEHQDLLCGYVLKWTPNNIPIETCPCKKFEAEDKLLSGLKVKEEGLKIILKEPQKQKGCGKTEYYWKDNISETYVCGKGWLCPSCSRIHARQGRNNRQRMRASRSPAGKNNTQENVKRSSISPEKEPDEEVVSSIIGETKPQTSGSDFDLSEKKFFVSGAYINKTNRGWVYPEKSVKTFIKKVEEDTKEMVQITLDLGNPEFAKGYKIGWDECIKAVLEIIRRRAGEKLR